MKAEAHGLIEELPGAEGFQCDVSSDGEIGHRFEQLKERYGKAGRAGTRRCFCPMLKIWCASNDFVNTSREGFRIAHDVSVYSLIAVIAGCGSADD